MLASLSAVTHRLRTNRLTKRLRELPLVVALTGTGVLLISGSTLAAQMVASHTVMKNSQGPQKFTSTINKQPEVNSITSDKSSHTKKTQGATSPQTTTQSSAQTVTRYAISPDPRSTAYSTTPPPPNPASFTTTITSNGQVAPGKLIDYNATKNARTYYGGDYVISTPTITMRRSEALVSPTFTISTPDGQVAEQPALPWYDTDTQYWVGTNSGGEASSWSMSISIASDIPLGTYQVHITSFRANVNGNDAWEYDGFITLNIVN